MQCKKACIVINPRSGQNVVKLTDVLAVFSAAGWRTDIAIKEYGGHTMELATRAAEKGYDLVVGYGGDGTLSQVVNGVMNAKGQHSIVGLIPGGTANVWATEIGVPVDPVKAALTLIDSECRKVDIGHVEVESLIFPDTSSGDQQKTIDEKTYKKKVKPTSDAKHHFLLMAGLGIDAAIMGHVSKPLKYKIGPLAVGFSAAKELSTQHPFPVEIRASGGGRNGDVLWKGEAIQVVIGNTRRYADIVQMTPNAYIDDGVLDVCVILAGDPLTSMQQIASLLLRREPDNLTSENFSGAHLTISVPASIDLQLDGTAVKLKDYLSKLDHEALQHAGDMEHVMVNYRFDAMPRVLRVAIPYSYNDALFENSAAKSQAEAQQAPEQSQAEHSGTPEQQKNHQHTDEAHNRHVDNVQVKFLEHLDAFLNDGRKVTVAGTTHNSHKKQMYVIAGSTAKRSTGEARPVAVRIDGNTTMMLRTGEHISPSYAMQKLQEGREIVVEGKQSKRGVIRATQVVV